MDMAENSVCVVDRKEIKLRNFAESETKHFVISHVKMLIMRYFVLLMRTHQSFGKDMMLGITARVKVRFYWSDCCDHR